MIIQCTCGARLRIQPGQAQKSLRCPRCRNSVSGPSPAQIRPPEAAQPRKRKRSLVDRFRKEATIHFDSRIAETGKRRAVIAHFIAAGLLGLLALLLTIANADMLPGLVLFVTFLAFAPHIAFHLGTGIFLSSWRRTAAAFSITIWYFSAVYGFIAGLLYLVMTFLTEEPLLIFIAAISWALGFLFWWLGRSLNHPAVWKKVVTELPAS